VKLKVRITSDANADMVRNAVYISGDSVDAGVRFIPAAFETIHGLAEFPGKGSPKPMRTPHLRGLKSFAVKGFPNHLIFYRVDSGNTLSVLGVLHGAQDWRRLLRKRK
jgi:toxin ParE1/3/4